MVERALQPSPRITHRALSSSMSIIPAQEKAAVAHFEVEDKLKGAEGHSLAPTTTAGTDQETGYAGSFIGATHKEEVRKAERKLLFKLGESVLVTVAEKLH